jgi:hypothetical protein
MPLAAFALYLLSDGPACWVSMRIRGQLVADFMNTFYGPIRWCAKQSLVTEEWHDWWILSWSTSKLLCQSPG